MAQQADEERPMYERKLIRDEIPEVRAGFITKVYGILFFQLLLTAAIAAPFVVVPSVNAFARSFGLPLLIFATILNLVFLCFMVCPCGCQENMRTVPTNYLLLFGFTATEGFLVGVICAHYTVASVLLAVVATAVVVGGLTAYAMLTKRDFTGLGPYLFAGLLVLMIFGLFAMLFPFPIMHKVYCCLGILLFSFYLIYDTQLIMGKGEQCIGIDDYVWAALQLYIDIIQMFMYILQLFGDRA